jgi:hypothetical protein
MVGNQASHRLIVGQLLQIRYAEPAKTLGRSTGDKFELSAQFC